MKNELSTELQNNLKNEIISVEDFNVHIYKSNRKSYAIKVIKENTIQVRVPKFFSNNDINNIIKKHYNWINKHLFLIKSTDTNLFKEINNFEKILIMNKIYLIEQIKDKNRKPHYIFTKNIDNQDIIQFINISNLENKIDIFMKHELKPIVNKLINDVREIHKVNIEFKKIKYSNAKTRWGSCSNKGNINLSWRLLMCPVDIIFSIIVHELTHLIHFNHSKKFYSFVDSIDFNREKSDKWLKDNSYILQLYRF